MTRICFAASVAAICLSPSAVFCGDPVSITPAVVEGDKIAGVGTVTAIDNLAINDSGEWLVEADTDFANTDEDIVLLKNGVQFLREGFGGLGDPSEAIIDSFDSVTLNNASQSGFNLFIDPFSSSQDSGVFLDTDLVFQESEFSNAPELSAETPLIGFFDVKINDTGTLLVTASVDDPAISSTVDRAVLLVDIDTGQQSVLVKEGDVLPGQTESLDDVGTGPHETAINDDGDVLFIAELAGDSATDNAIYLNETLLAQEGFASPLKGRNWEFLSSRGLDLNDAGDYAHKGNLDGDTADDDVLVVNGEIFKQEGTGAIDEFLFTGFGTSSGPIQIDNAGNVLWFGEWDDPDASVNSGLFLNDTLLVQEGVTMIDGMVVDTIAAGSDAFAISDNGQWIIFEATLDGSINGAFIIELDTILVGDVNCDGMISLADIPAFVEVLSTGGFSEKADINGDGEVSLEDIPLFVALLAGTP